MDSTNNVPPAPPGARLADAARRGRGVGAAAAGAMFCLTLVAVGQVIAHLRPDDRDRWLYAYFGERVLAGESLYADLWDVKPPLNYWLNAAGLWVGGGSYYGVMACCAVVSFLTVAAVYFASRAFCGRGASLLVTLMGAIYLTHSFWFGGTNRPESLEVLFELTAAGFYLGHLRRFSVWRLLAAGVACGLAVGAKQTALALIAAIVLDQLGRLLWVSSRRGAAAGLVVVVVGFGVGLAAWLAPTLQAARAEDVYQALVGFHRLDLISSEVNPLWPRMLSFSATGRLLALPLILAVAAVLHAALNVPFVRRRISGGPVSSVGGGQGAVAVLLMWLVLCLYLIALAPHEHTHYWLLAVGPLLLLSARSIDLLIGEFGVLEAMRRKISTTVAVVAGAFLVYQPLALQVGQLAQKWYYQQDVLYPPVPCKIAEVIGADAGAGDTVFVWGHSPGIVWRLHRPYPTRFVGTHFFELRGGLGQPLFDEMLDDLKRAPPGYLVLGSEPADLAARESAHFGLDISGFVHLIEWAYKPWQSVGGNTIYRLRGTSG